MKFLMTSTSNVLALHEFLQNFPLTLSAIIVIKRSEKDFSIKFLDSLESLWKNGVYIYFLLNNMQYTLIYSN